MSNDAILHKEVPFGVRKLKFNIQRIYSQKSKNAMAPMGKIKQFFKRS